MAWSQGSGDYLLRRFLGDHFDGPLDEVLSPGRQQEQEISNPNLEDLPPEPRGSGVTRVQEGNVFWSERANTEHVLRQMRPEHLPPLDASVSIQGSERGRASHSLSDPPFGAEEWLQTAREMDRQTSIGHLPEPQAIQFLRDSAGIGQREPEYFFMAAADTPEERSLHRQDDGSEMMNRDTALGRLPGRRAGEPLVGRSPEQCPPESGACSGTPLGGRTGEPLISECPKKHPSQLGSDRVTFSGRKPEEHSAGQAFEGCGSQRGIGAHQGQMTGNRQEIRTQGELTRLSLSERDMNTMSAQDIYSRLQTEGAAPQWLATLLRRLAEAEQRTKSSSSLYSAVEHVQDHSSVGRQFRPVQDPSSVGLQFAHVQDPSSVGLASSMGEMGETFRV